MKFPCLLPALAISLLASGTHASTLLVSEFFDYADGSLTGQTPAPGPGGTWQDHSGTTGDLLVTGQQAVIQHGIPSEDTNIDFVAQSSGILTATFDIVVQDDTVIGEGGTDFEYFAHFMPRGTFTFTSRLDIQAPNVATVGNDYTLGVATTNSTAESTLTSDFSFGDTIGVTLTYDFTTGLSSLTVGSETVVSTTVGTVASLDAFALRQSDSSNNETITVDNLMITVVPEPSVALLGGLGLLGLIRRRR